MSAITANTDVSVKPDLRFNKLPVKAATRIYSGSVVGTHYVTGYAQPFVPTNVFAGIAYGEANNTDGTAGYLGSNPHLATDTADGGRVQVMTQGDVVCQLASASQDDVGKAVYAQDSSTTVLLTGHPDAYMGRVIAVNGDADGAYSTTEVIVRLDIGGKSVLADIGHVECVLNRGFMAPITGAASAQTANGNFLFSSVLGLGFTNVAEGINGECDATSEAAGNCIETPAIFDPSKGVTFDATLAVSVLGGATADFDWGVGDVLTNATRADMDAAGLLNHCRFHVDGDSANILAESDDNTTDTGAIDTTVDNSLTVKKRYVILVLTDGTCEMFIDGTQVLTSTSFAVGTTAALAGFINSEKTSTATPEIQVASMRVAGVADA